MDLTEEEDLNFARQKLIEALGDKSQAYFNHLKLWFQMKLTKTEFDQEARKLLEDKHVRLHNIFLIALVNKCQLSASHSRVINTETKETTIREKFIKGRLKKKAKLERSTYDPPNIRDYIHESLPFPAQILSESPRYCAQEGFLPEKALIYGRLILAAWDCNLGGAEEVAANLIVSASKLFIKNILVSIIKLRKTTKEKDGISLGFTPNSLNCFVANSARTFEERKVFQDESFEEEKYHIPKHFTTVEQKLQNEALEEACTLESKPRYKINSFDLYTALKVFPEVIPSNTIYQINMHRIINKLYHKIDIEDMEINKNEV